MRVIIYTQAPTTLILLPVLLFVGFWPRFSIGKRRCKPLPRFRWFTFVLIVFVFATFLVTKPSYTYEQGKTYLESRNYTAVELLEPRSLISFNLERNYFITSAYLYTGRKNGHDYYLLLQPKTGEFESLKVNSGNYIDHYFEMLDSMSAH